MQIVGHCRSVAYTADPVWPNPQYQIRRYDVSPTPNVFVFDVGDPGACAEYVKVVLFTDSSQTGVTPEKYNLDWDVWVDGVESAVYLNWVYAGIPYKRSSDKIKYCDQTVITVSEADNRGPC